MAIDGKTETFWDDRDNAPEYELGLTFAQPSTLSILSITGWQHEDFAPRDFTLLADGKPVGGVKGAGYQSNRLVIRFPKLSCTRFALRISAAYGGSPAIRELELYE
jgi:hypothetical protein